MRTGILTFAALTALAPLAARAEIVFNSIPSPLPASMASFGYEADSIAEFGMAITLAGTNRNVNTVSVTMVNWSYESTFEPVGTSAGYYVPMTLSFYNVDPTAGSAPPVGSLIGSTTVDEFIPWRPEPNAACAGTEWSNGSTCQNGQADTISFNIYGQTLPDNVIVGLAFNTQAHGANPTGVDGPYDSLNIGLEGSTTTGAVLNPDTMYVNTTYAGFLTNPGPGVPGVFSADTGYTPYELSLSVDVPEPAGLALVVTGLFGLAAARRRAA